MVFSSLTFIYYFLPILILLYYGTKSSTIRNLVLIAGSLFFYGWGEPVWISLMVVSAIVDFTNGKIIDRNRDNVLRHVALIASIVINLSFLGFFKYYGFLVDNINYIFGLSIKYHQLSLPIGISFYTFQTLSYTFDVYRGHAKVQNSFIKFLMFVSLFPQLVAGPIVRYVDIAEQIDHRKGNFAQFSAGVTRFCTGLAKKVIIANTVGELSDLFLKGDFSKISVVGAWLGILLYAFQIYFDFSGYSDMAIGLGKMFGFDFKENFNYPYISKSAAEFWRRWHISLGSFFRDYVYIPLGGNRKHFIRNVLIVWFLTGLWHGASWNFIIWGMYYGLLIFLERKLYGHILEKLPSWIRHLYLIVIMLVGWVFFYYVDLGTGLKYLGMMVGIGATSFIDPITWIHIKSNIVLIFFAMLFSTPVFTRIKQLFSSRLSRFNLDLQVVWNLIMIFLSTTMLVGQSYNPFLYFRF
ncbi:MBOAT family O-acyltransferase [Fusibacter bizertensis]